MSFDIEYCDSQNPQIGDMATCEDRVNCMYCGGGEYCCDYYCYGSNCYNV